MLFEDKDMLHNQGIPHKDFLASIYSTKWQMNFRQNDYLLSLSL